MRNPLQHSSKSISAKRISSSLFDRKSKEVSEAKELRHELEAFDSPMSHMFPPPEIAPEHVHIVVFSPGTHNQGIHTIQDATGVNVVLAFCDEQSCRDFCRQLQEWTNILDRHPEVQRVVYGDLLDFGDGEGLVCQVIPSDVRVQPPVKNVPTLGSHNKELLRQRKQLQYVLYMVDEFDDDEQETWDGAAREMEGVPAWQ